MSFASSLEPTANCNICYDPVHGKPAPTPFTAQNRLRHSNFAVLKLEVSAFRRHNSPPNILFIFGTEMQNTEVYTLQKHSKVLIFLTIYK